MLFTKISSPLTLIFKEYFFVLGESEMQPMCLWPTLHRMRFAGQDSNLESNWLKWSLRLPSQAKPCKPILKFVLHDTLGSHSRILNKGLLTFWKVYISWNFPFDQDFLGGLSLKLSSKFQSWHYLSQRLWEKKALKAHFQNCQFQRLA